MTDTPTMEEIRAEMRRTVYQKKAVSKMSPKETLDYAVSFFKDAGYRAGLTGRPNQMFIMGGREGILPRVTGEIKLQIDVGKGKVTMVTMDSTGEKLHEVMKMFHTSLRNVSKVNETSTSTTTD